ncbi:MAG: SCO family protein [Brumimicrobium sp.]
MNRFKTLMTFFLVILFFSCEEEKKDKSGLPFIGQHDVVYEATENHEVGDTIFHKVPGFKYLTQDSTWLSSKDIDDKVWIAKFFFTHCPTICPPMTSAMKEVTKELSSSSDEIIFLSFSIDPDRDTPKRLRTYINRHEINAKNWYFLTGDEAKTHELGVKGFNILAQADKEAPGGFAHSPNFVLVDSDQHIRGIYDGLNPDERKRLIKDVNKLLEHE